MRLLLSNNKEVTVIEIHKACTIACSACIFAKTVTKIHYSGLSINRSLYCTKYKKLIYSRKFIRSYMHKVVLFTSALQYKVLI